MKSETWSIEDGKLICCYETYRGKNGKAVFTHTSTRNGKMNFKKEGTQRIINGVEWDNLNKCYTALYNTTDLRAFIRCDLSVFL